MSDAEVKGAAPSSNGVGDNVAAAAGDPTNTVAAGARATASAGAATGTDKSGGAGATPSDSAATAAQPQSARLAELPSVPVGLSRAAVVPGERPFAVLVAGEHWQVITGERSMGANYCSLVPVGQAYAQLVDQIGRENIGALVACGGRSLVAVPCTVLTRTTTLPMLCPHGASRDRAVGYGHSVATQCGGDGVPCLQPTL